MSAQRFGPSQWPDRSDAAGPGRGEGGVGDGWDGVLGPERLAADALLRSTHDFLVDTLGGREVGVVENVVTDPITGRVVRLEVVSGWFARRRRIVDVDDVIEILPNDRRIVVDARVVGSQRR